MAKTVAAGDVQWKTILEDVEKNREEVVITKDGEPIARVLPIDDAGQGPMFGRIQIPGDLLAPLDEEWEANG